MRLKNLLTGVALLGGMMTGTALANPITFKEVAKIPLPCQPGHGDWVAYDPGNHDVYVSLHGGGMAVVNTDTNTVIHNFPSVTEPNTMTFDDNYVYETQAEGPGAGKSNQIIVIDKNTWQIVDRVDTVGTSPDGTFIDKANGRLYVAMDDDNSIDEYTTGAHPKYIKKIMLLPKNPVAGPDVASLYNGWIYATDDAYVEKIDPNTGKIAAIVNYHLKLNDFGGTKGMFYDRAHDVLWVGTTTGGMLLINPDNLEVEKHLKMTAGADAVIADHGLGIGYAFEGGIPGFDYYDIKDQKFLGTVKTGTAKPTHSGAVDPVTHRVYAYAGGEAALIVYQPEE
ncbi:MAG: YncE family protein [Rhodospirillales bacterium]|nr:YncE family protein [Rhodospirillales bacterium]